MGFLERLFVVHKSRKFDSAILAVLFFGAIGSTLYYPNQLLVVNFLVFVALAQGINILYGFTGYLPFGYVGFFGAGAYGFALSLMLWHVPTIVGFGVGVFVAFGVGIILVPLLRLGGAYFAIANLAAALALREIVSNPNLEPLTRGPYGITLSNAYQPTVASLTAVLLALGATVAVLIFKYSEFGLALRAVRDDPESAAAAGIKVVRTRVIAWSCSAAIAGAAGASFAWYVNSFYPDTVFALDYSLFAIVFALFGGVGSVFGPILGTLILYTLYNYIGIAAPQYFSLLYGVLIVVLVLFFPKGLLGLTSRWTQSDDA